MTPFPAVIDGHRWRVREGRWPSFIERRGDEGWLMQVPLSDTEEARKLRLHEQAHVAWTPNVTEEDVARNYGIEVRTLNACEDGRIIKMMGDRSPGWKDVNEQNDLLAEVIINQHEQEFHRLALKLAGRSDEGGTHDQGTAALTKGPSKETMSLLEAARLVASSRGYCEGNHFDRITRSVGLEWVKDTVNEMHKRHLGSKKEPTFEDTVAYAQELEEYFNEMEDTLAAQVLDIESADLQVPGLTQVIDEDEDRWGDMEIQIAPLTERLQGDPTRKVRATDLGAIPRYMHRLPTDQRVFGRHRKHRRFRGTVLIDHSGSMSLRARQVDEILQRWPAVTIATYSGNADNVRGTLRIVAKSGRRASHDWLECPGAGSNVIDGPALDWLAKQRGPRIWVSDGVVTGIGERQTPALLLSAARKVNRGKIKRIPNVQQLLGS